MAEVVEGVNIVSVTMVVVVAPDLKLRQSCDLIVSMLVGPVAPFDLPFSLYLVRSCMINLLAQKLRGSECQGRVP